MNYLPGCDKDTVSQVNVPQFPHLCKKSGGILTLQEILGSLLNVGLPDHGDLFAVSKSLCWVEVGPWTRYLSTAWL